MVTDKTIYLRFLNVFEDNLDLQQYLAKTYFNYEDYLESEESKRVAFKGLFTYSFDVLTYYIIHGQYFNEEAQNNIIKLINKRDYKGAFYAVLYEWEYAYIPITLSWDEYPKLLNRRFMIPIRENLSTLLYISLALLRADGSSLACIMIDKYCFITEAEYSTAIQKGLSDDSILLNIMSMALSLDYKSAKLMYDYSEGYIFNIRFRKPRYIKESYKGERFIIEDAIGYGIYEHDKMSLLDFLNNEHPLSDFDFYDTKFDQLITFIKHDFYQIEENYSVDDFAMAPLEVEEYDTKIVS